MKISKDIYEYIIYFVDVSDILNMLSVNKFFSRDEILLRIMNKRYPKLILNDKDEPRKFYSQMLYYITKLNNIGIPYIHHKSFNPMKIFYASDKLNIVMKYATKIGRIDIVESMIEKGANDYIQSVYYACKFENIEIINLLMLKGNIDIQTVLLQLLLFGKIELVDYFLKNISEEKMKSHRILETLIRIAGIKGDLKMVNFLLEKNEANLEYAISGAASESKMNILNYFMEKGYDDYNNILCSAASGGQAKLMKLMIKKGATDFSRASEIIAKCDYFNLFNFFTKYEKKEKIK